MMSFLKKWIKPILEKVKIYTLSRKIFLSFYILKTKITNSYFKKTQKTAPILLYHRIENVSNDPVLLCVSPETFEKHLIFIKDNYDVISLSELSGRIISKNLIGNEAAITFDDGYQDNITNALPLLEKYDIPATIFITTDSLGEKASFEWDLQYNESDRAVFLNKKEIQKLSNNRLIELGAHTHSHKKLSTLSLQEQMREIAESKKILEDIMGKNIKLFAYPFGGKLDFNNSTKNILSNTEFDFAYSNTNEIANEKNKRYSIPRINIRDCDLNKLSKLILLNTK
jgi:peptidoglycan/xylan/chitin deacetylase (PgdA/CDA1 family)